MSRSNGDFFVSRANASAKGELHMQMIFLKGLSLIGFVALLMGCASAPPKPYWDNPEWVAALNTSIQSLITYPSIEAQKGWPVLNAVVEFTYESRQLENLRIVQTTGSDRLDYYFIIQIEKVRDLPWSYGSYASVPHTFQVKIDLKPTRRDFYTVLRRNIERQTHYPRAVLPTKEQGWVILGFSYRNGTVLNVAVVKSSGSHAFEKAAVDQLKNIKLPSPPPSMDLSGKVLHFTISFCYLLPGNACVVNYPF